MKYSFSNLLKVSILPCAFLISLTQSQGAAFIATLDEDQGRSSFSNLLNGGKSYADGASNGEASDFGPSTNLGSQTSGIAYTTRSNGSITYSVFDAVANTTASTMTINTNLSGFLSKNGYTPNTLVTTSTSSNNYLIGNGQVGYSPNSPLIDPKSTAIRAFSPFNREANLNQSGSLNAFGFDSNNSNPNVPNSPSGDRRETLIIQFSQVMGHWGANLVDFESRLWDNGTPSGITAQLYTFRNGSLIDNKNIDYQDLGNNYSGYAGDKDITFLGYYAEDASEGFDTIMLVVGGKSSASADANRWAVGNSIFGESIEGGQSVPEPSSAWLTFLSSCLFLMHRKRR